MKQTRQRFANHVTAVCVTVVFVYGSDLLLRFGLTHLELPVHMTLCPFTDYKKTSLKGYMDTFRVFLKGIDAENKAALRRERLGMNQDAILLA
jgi:hypothetical protein